MMHSCARRTLYRFSCTMTHEGMTVRTVERTLQPSYSSLFGLLLSKRTFCGHLSGTAALAGARLFAGTPPQEEQEGARAGAVCPFCSSARGSQPPGGHGQGGGGSGSQQGRCWQGRWGDRGVAGGGPWGRGPARERRSAARRGCRRRCQSSPLLRRSSSMTLLVPYFSVMMRGIALATSSSMP